MKDLTILVVTFARPEVIQKTLYAFLKCAQYPRENLHFHLADNNTEIRANILNYTQDIINNFHYLDWTYSIETKQGWGYNVNTALQQIKTDYTFLIEDDYVAHREFDLIAGVNLMEAKPHIASIRYDGIAAHDGLILHLREADAESGKVDYCIIDKNSNHLNIYSNRPHLRHTRFTECYGYYPEGLTLGQTEEAMAHCVRDKKQCGDIVILGDGIANTFYHVGKTFQGSEYDKQ